MEQFAESLDLMAVPAPVESVFAPGPMQQVQVQELNQGKDSAI